jgi:hypothetical protein
MPFYSDLATTVDRLIRQFGAPVTLTRVTPGAYDADAGVTTGDTTATWTGGAGAVFEYEQRDIDGTLIRRGDQRCYISTVGIETPRSGDTLTLNSDVFNVVASRPLQPALTAVLHDVQIRGLR